MTDRDCDLGLASTPAAQHHHATMHHQRDRAVAHQRPTPADLRFFEAFKPVRNLIQKYPMSEVVLGAIRHLHTNDYTDIQVFRTRQPWFYYLLIKWALCYGVERPVKDRHVDDAALSRLINSIHDVDGESRRPSEFEHLFLYFRSLAYQQFWLQERLSHAALARQFALLGHLSSAHPIRRAFFAATGVEIERWFRLAFAIMAIVLADRDGRALSVESFRTLAPVYPPEEMRRTLDSLARSPEDLRSFLLEREPPVKTAGEFFERTPLLRHPLLRLGNQYRSYSPQLFYHGIRDFAFDLLRHHDAEAFMRAFGPAFERYVERSLAYSQGAFLGPEDVRSHVPNDRPCADFFVHADERNVLVDAKGVELPPSGMTEYRAERVAYRTRDSAIKGIVQVVETAAWLRKAAAFANRDWSPAATFALIVTYKHLFLATGRRFAEGCAQAKLARALQETTDSSAIPLAHIYFVSIDEFDRMNEIARAHGLSLGEQLRRAVQADAKPETSKFLMLQHCLAIDPEAPAPAFLEEELDTQTDGIARAIEASEARAK